MHLKGKPATAGGGGDASERARAALEVLQELREAVGRVAHVGGGDVRLGDAGLAVRRLGGDLGVLLGAGDEAGAGVELHDGGDGQGVGVGGGDLVGSVDLLVGLVWRSGGLGVVVVRTDLGALLGLGLGEGHGGGGRQGGEEERGELHVDGWVGDGGLECGLDSWSSECKCCCDDDSKERQRSARKGDTYTRIFEALSSKTVSRGSSHNKERSAWIRRLPRCIHVGVIVGNPAPIVHIGRLGEAAPCTWTLRPCPTSPTLPRKDE